MMRFLSCIAIDAIAVGCIFGLWLLALRRAQRTGEARSFSLILAYVQTLRAQKRHPEDVDPRANPAFAPARRALSDLVRTAPLLIASAIAAGLALIRMFG